MKPLTTLAILAPGSALAHGGHAVLAEPAHSGFHVSPVAIGLGLIAVALVLWRARE